MRNSRSGFSGSESEVFAISRASTLVCASVIDLTFSPTPPNTSSAEISGRFFSSFLTCAGLVNAVCVALISDSFLVYFAAANTFADENNESITIAVLRMFIAHTCRPP